MMAKISRHDLLSSPADEVATDTALCPVCGMSVASGTENLSAACRRCDEARDAAAFVDYDGCC